MKPGDERLIVDAGQRFGRLVVVAPRVFIPDRKGHRLIFCKVRCDCGQERLVLKKNLAYGNSTSCGCLFREMVAARNRIHDGSGSNLYNRWRGLKTRCYNPKSERYPNYGGRGITVCPQWLHSYETFRDWAISNGWDPTLSLERIDVDQGYSPENCCFIPMSAQVLNTTKSRWLTCWGETKILSEWITDQRCKVAYKTLAYRVKSGWPADIALTLAPHARNRPLRARAVDDSSQTSELRK